MTYHSTQAKFHGAQAHVNVWRPYVQEEYEFSLAQIWLSTGSYSTQLETVEAGWNLEGLSFLAIVCRNLYVDNQPRYLTDWTVAIITGFVNINQAFALGSPIPQVSAINGQQIDLPISIWKDFSSGNWWLSFSPHLIVGYWPAALFNRLRNGGTQIQWGGEIVNLKNNSRHTHTVMGSGLFAAEGYRKASYFKNVEVIDEHDIVK